MDDGPVARERDQRGLIQIAGSPEVKLASSQLGKYDQAEPT